jgi:hypothetical protein
VYLHEFIAADGISILFSLFALLCLPITISSSTTDVQKIKELKTTIISSNLILETDNTTSFLLPPVPLTFPAKFAWKEKVLRELPSRFKLCCTALIMTLLLRSFKPQDEFICIVSLVHFIQKEVRNAKKPELFNDLFVLPQKSFLHTVPAQLLSSSFVTGKYPLSLLCPAFGDFCKLSKKAWDGLARTDELGLGGKCVMM